MMDFWGRKKAPEIKNLIPIVNGIFSNMTGYTFKADISKEQLDFMLISNYGKRNPAPVVDLIAEKYDLPLDEELSQTAIQELAQLMLGMYKPKWDKLGEIYDIEYDPIHNYLDEWEDESDESRDSTRSNDNTITDTLGTTITKQNTRTDNLSESKSGQVTSSLTRTDNLREVVDRDLSNSSTRTDNLTELETRNLADSHSGSEANNVFAFDSVSAVGHDTNSNSNSGTNTGTVNTANTGTQSNAGSGTEDVTTTNSGTQQNAGTSSDSETILNTGTQSDNGSEATTGTNRRVEDKDETFSETAGRERSGRHFGNIGNLTSQKQIQEEIELWKWNYMHSILDDAKHFLCLDVYLN